MVYLGILLHFNILRIQTLCQDHFSINFSFAQPITVLPCFWFGYASIPFSLVTFGRV